MNQVKSSVRANITTGNTNAEMNNTAKAHTRPLRRRTISLLRQKLTVGFFSFAVTAATTFRAFGTAIFEKIASSLNGSTVRLNLY